MKKTLELTEGLVSYDTKDIILEIFPELENSFTQRKHYSEFYFKPTDVEFDLKQIEQLLEEFKITLTSDYIQIT